MNRWRKTSLLWDFPWDSSHGNLTWNSSNQVPMATARHFLHLHWMTATNNGKGQWWRIWTAPLMAPLDGAWENGKPWKSLFWKTTKINRVAFEIAISCDRIHFHTHLVAVLKFPWLFCGGFLGSVTCFCSKSSNVGNQMITFEFRRVQTSHVC